MKVYNKLLSFALAFTLLFLPVVAQAKGYSGGSSSSSSRSSSSVHSSSSNSGTYHSGYKAPSSSVQSKQPSYNNNSGNTQAQSKPKSSFFSHAAAFGAGAFLGSMLHPFGSMGMGGMGVGHGFSLFGLLADILVIALIVWVFRRIFARR